MCYKRKIFIKSLILFFIFSATSIAKEVPDHSETNYNTDFCASDGSKFDHVMIVIDLTSKLDSAQINYIKKKVFSSNFYKSYAPMTKFSYFLINQTHPSSQKLVFSKCRPKTGDKKSKFESDSATWSESKKYLEEAYVRFLSGAFTASNSIFKDVVKSQRSLIYESLITILDDISLDFTSESNYDNRKLIIISDFMQHSDRLSFYKVCTTSSAYGGKPDSCPSFSKLKRYEPSFWDYISDTTPREKDLDLELIFLNFVYAQEQKASLAKSLISLWENYFKHFGFKTPEVTRMVDIK